MDFTSNYYLCVMETLIVHPDNNEKLSALKAVMKALKIRFEVSEEAPAQSVAEDILESMKEVKLHQAGKIRLQDARDLLNEL
jgi:hypothetical protein